MKIGLQGTLSFLNTARASWGTTTNGITSGSAPTGLAVVAHVEDVSIDLSKTEVAANSRDNVGWETVIGALRKSPLEFKLFYDPADPGQLAILQAFLQTGVYVPLAVLDGPAATAGTEGIWADFEILGMKKAEELEGVQAFDVTAKPSAFSSVPPQWVKVTTGS